jgi:hypothetical protein
LQTILNGTAPTEVNDGLPPYKQSFVDYAVCNPSFFNSDSIYAATEGGINANTKTKYMYAVIQNVPTIIGCSISWWVDGDTNDGNPISAPAWNTSGSINPVPGVFTYCSTATSDQFVAGTTSIAYHQWEQWGTSSLNASGGSISPMLGDITTPALPTPTLDPALPGSAYYSAESALGGWSVKAAAAIILWSFQYTGPTS